MASEDRENLAHLKSVFLQGCETFLKPLKDFDYDTFVLKINELLKDNEELE